MTKRKAMRASALFAIYSAYAVASPITINFSSSLVTGARGQTVTFSASITNTTSAPVFLNGDSLNITAPLVGDDTKFFLNSPLFVAGSTTTSVFPIFDITIPASAPVGVYSGDFTIQGGANPSAFDDVGSKTFAVNVVPEPGDWWLTGGAIAVLCAVRRRIRPRDRCPAD
jgi:hypothetical protein